MIPEAEDIKRVVDGAVKELTEEPDGSLIEIGRLIIQKNGKSIDLYLHIGETI